MHLSMIDEHIVLVKFGFNSFNGWKHNKGGTIVITLYFIHRCHVWTSIMSLLWRILTIFLFIMVHVKTQKNQMPNKLHFLIAHDVMLKYLCAKTYTSQCIKKIQIYSRNDWNIFLIFVEFLISTKHCDSIWLK
jgi:hypothetical protein